MSGWWLNGKHRWSEFTVIKNCYFIRSAGMMFVNLNHPQPQRMLLSWAFESISHTFMLDYFWAFIIKKL